MTEPAAAARTVRVHLADAPTDVLVWLVGQPSHLWWSVEQITAATAPDDADDATATVAKALALLRQMGYVVRSQEAQVWAATADGQSAVTDARPLMPVDDAPAGRGLGAPRERMTP